MRPFVLTALLCLGLATPAWAQNSSDKDTGVEGPAQLDAAQLDRAKAIDTEADALQRALRGLARTGADRPTSVAAALREVPGPNTPANIYDWVREHIAFEPYAGAIRGARGTLVAGSANAADQALLLHAMLAEAGHTARFVTGSVYDKDAIARLESYAGKATLLVPSAISEADDYTDLSVLNDPRYVDLVSEHTWVEVDVDGAYRPADPVFGAHFGMTPARAKQRHDQAPASVESRLKIELVVDLTDGQRQVLLTAAGPLSQFAYEALALRFEPDLVRDGWLRPLFDLADVATTGQRFPPGETAALTLRYELDIGKRQHRWSSDLYRKGAGANPFAFDHQHYTIAVVPGWTSDAAVAELAAARLAEASESLEDWAVDRRRSKTADDPRKFRTRIDATLDDVNALLPFVYLRHLDRLSRRTARTLGVHPVLGAPRVVTTGLLRRGDQWTVDVTLHGEGLEAIPRVGIPRAAATGFLTLMGRVQNEFEDAVLARLSSAQILTVSRIFEAALAQRTPFTTIYSGNVDGLSEYGYDDQTRQTLRERAVDKGRVLLVPTKPVTFADAPYLGWWELDPGTGMVSAGITDSLVDTAAAKTTADQTAIARSTLTLAAQVGEAVAQAVEGSSAYDDEVCDARDDIVRVVRAFCAKKKLVDLPALATCLKPADDDAVNSGSGIVIPRQSCATQTAPARCGAVVAGAFLDGKLTALQSRREDGKSDNKKKRKGEGGARYNAATGLTCK